MKRFLIFLILLISAASFAQEATPEATPEVTSEFTAEATAAVSAEVTAEFTVEADQCPVLVQQALQVTETSCSTTGSNQACYGYILVDAELRNTEAEFVEQGDTADLVSIESVQLSPMDTQTGQWGVMIMQVEAAPTAESTAEPGSEDVQVVLFGDTEVSAAVPFVEVRARENSNIRRQPRTDAEILGTLAAGEPILANARLENNQWIRVRLAGEENPVGWISTELLEIEADISVLISFTAEEAELPPTDVGATYGPMQAFVYESGENANLPCAAAPNGLLIQTPEGAASVTLWMDEVVIELDGTGVVTAQADGSMTVGILEGSAQVTANGDTRTVVEGQATDIEMSSDLSPEGSPSDPRPLEESETAGLPTTLLDEPVTIPEPLDNTVIMPIAGQWSYTPNATSPLICSDGSEVTLDTTGVPATITPQLDAINFSGLLFPEVAEGVYRLNYTDGSGNLVQDTLQLVSTDRITGERTIDLLQPVCTVTFSFTLQLIQPS